MSESFNVLFTVYEPISFVHCIITVYALMLIIDIDINYRSVMSFQFRSICINAEVQT